MIRKGDFVSMRKTTLVTNQQGARILLSNVAIGIVDFVDGVGVMVRFIVSPSNEVWLYEKEDFFYLRLAKPVSGNIVTLDEPVETIKVYPDYDEIDVTYEAGDKVTIYTSNEEKLTLNVDFEEQDVCNQVINWNQTKEGKWYLKLLEEYKKEN